MILWNYYRVGGRETKVVILLLVPQGSVLNPILFHVYINDLPERVKSRVRLFADDNAMFLALSSHIEGQVLQNDLLSLGEWEKIWDMNFNPSKCQVIHVTSFYLLINTHFTLYKLISPPPPPPPLFYAFISLTPFCTWSTATHLTSPSGVKT